MNLLMLLQELDLGSLPSPPPRAAGSSWLEFIVEIFPLFWSGMMLVVMVFSILYRHNQRFHDFWEEHICGWIEEHGHRCELERKER